MGQTLGALLGNTAFYLWDTSGASLLWTLLDPQGIAVANNVFASADPLNKVGLPAVLLLALGTVFIFSSHQLLASAKWNALGVWSEGGVSEYHQ